jgi:hypothetical protein
MVTLLYCRYCSKECQQAAYHLHKPVCKRLKAVVAAAAAEASPRRPQLQQQV